MSGKAKFKNSTRYTPFIGREGQEVTIIRTITEPDATHDEEVLPMHVVRFPDGVELELYPDELEEA